MNQGISPVIGVMLMVAVTVSLVGLVTIITLDISDNTKSTQVPDTSIKATQTSQGLKTTVIRNENVDEYIVQGPDEKNVSLDPDTGSVSTVGDGAGRYDVVAVTNDGTRQVVRTTEIEEGSEAANARTPTFTQQGKVTINPPINNAIVISVEDGIVMDRTTTNSNGEFSIGASEDSNISVIVDGFDSSQITGSLYASARKQSQRSSNLNFDFNEDQSNLVSINGDDLLISYYSETAENTIGTAEQLQAINQISGAESQDYELIRNIDISNSNNIDNFNPIGSSTTQFTGNFDGNGHTITNLYIDRSTESRVGLFGEAISTNITNLNLESVDVTGQEYVGGLVGLVEYSSDSSLQNITVSGSVSGTDSSVGGLVGLYQGSDSSNLTSSATVTGSTDFVGGLIGDLDKDDDDSIQLKDSSATGDVTGSTSVGGLIGVNRGAILTNTNAKGDVTGDNKVGGLVGAAYWDTVGSHATGSVKANTDTVGGLIGLLENGEVRSSYSESTVQGSQYVGGLIGRAFYQGTLVQNSHSTGSITSTGEYVGGLIGATEITEINQSYSTSSIDAQGNGKVGGLVGSLTGTASINESYADITITDGGYNTGGLAGVTRDSSTISESYSKGSISSTTSAGGLVGFYKGGNFTNSYSKVDVSTTNNAGGAISALRTSATVEDIYAAGTVSSSGTAGGFADLVFKGSFTNTYWDTESTGQSTSAGSSTGLTSSELQGENASSNLTGFDFTDVWTTTDGYPELQNNQE